MLSPSWVTYEQVSGHTVHHEHRAIIVRMQLHTGLSIHNGQLDIIGGKYFR